MKKNLTLIYRAKRPGARSMERLFDCLMPYFSREFEVKRLVLPTCRVNPRAMLRNGRFVRNQAKGIVHIIGDVHYLGCFLSPKTTVLTIHDCGRLSSVSGVREALMRSLWYKWPMRRIRKVTTVSSYTKDTLIGQFGEVAAKIRIVHNCVLTEALPGRAEFNQEQPVILQIGGGLHKNLGGLIRACEGLKVRLKIVGSIHRENKAALERSNIDYSNEVDVSDQRMHELYRDSDILFFASLHEGFGLPIIEAQQAGLPVITSKCMSMPEVAGNAAILVDPNSAEEIRIAITSLITSAETRETLVARGFENVKRFTPEVTAEKYMAIYRELAEE